MLFRPGLLVVLAAVRQLELMLVPIGATNVHLGTAANRHIGDLEAVGPLGERKDDLADQGGERVLGLLATAATIPPGLPEACQRNDGRQHADRMHGRLH